MPLIKLRRLAAQLVEVAGDPLILTRPNGMAGEQCPALAELRVNLLKLNACRVQASAADGLPGTVYGTLHGGMQFRIARRVDLHASGGMFGVHVGGHAPLLNPYWDIGLSVYFDVPRRRRAQGRVAYLSR